MHSVQLVRYNPEQKRGAKTGFLKLTSPAGSLPEGAVWLKASPVMSAGGLAGGAGLPVTVCAVRRLQGQMAPGGWRPSCAS